VPHELILYTRAGCHLCDRLVSLIAPLAKQPERFTLVHRDIEENGDWYEQFWSRIPVLTLDDRVLLEGRPSEAEVQRVMRELLG